MIPADQAKRLGMRSGNELISRLTGSQAQVQKKKKKISKKANFTNTYTRKCTVVNKITLRQVSYDSVFPKHTDQRHPDAQTLNHSDG